MPSRTASDWARTPPPSIAHENVELVLGLGQHQGLLDGQLVGFEVEIVLEGAGPFIDEKRDFAFPVSARKTLAMDVFRFPVP